MSPSIQFGINVIGIAVILLCGSMSASGSNPQAEKHAHAYAKRQGWEVRYIECWRDDRLKDYYVACKFHLAPPRSYRMRECATDRSKVPGCREPRVLFP